MYVQENRHMYRPKGVLLGRSNPSGLFPFHFHLLPAMPMALLADGGWRALPLARATAVGQGWVMNVLNRLACLRTISRHCLMYEPHAAIQIIQGGCFTIPAPHTNWLLKNCL